MDETKPSIRRIKAEIGAGIKRERSLGKISVVLSLAFSPAICLLYLALFSAKSLIDRTFEINVFSVVLILGGLSSLAGFILAGMAVISPKSKTDFRMGLTGVLLNLLLACLVGFLLVFGMTALML